MEAARCCAVALSFLGLQLSPLADALAQPYPSRVIRYLIPTSAGAGADVIGRVVAGGMSDALGQQIIVDNRAGAAGNIGAALAARAAPDGYTLFQVTFQHTVNATLYRDLQYDLVRDFAPVTRLGSSPAVLVVHPSLPVKSVAELVRLARAQPNGIQFASAGFGSPTFVAAELFKRMAGVELMHVPYRGGGPALVAMLTGETSLMFAPLTALPHIRQGRLRPLAMTSTRRLDLAPDYPTLAEAGYPGYEFGFWHGLMVPARTPSGPVVIARKAVLAAFERPEVRQRLGELGYTTAGDEPEAFDRFIRADIERWRKTLGDQYPAGR